VGDAHTRDDLNIIISLLPSSEVESPGLPRAGAQLFLRAHSIGQKVAWMRALFGALQPQQQGPAGDDSAAVAAAAAAAAADDDADADAAAAAAAAADGATDGGGSTATAAATAAASAAALHVPKPKVVEALWKEYNRCVCASGCRPFFLLLLWLPTRTRLTRAPSPPGGRMFRYRSPHYSSLPQGSGIVMVVGWLCVCVLSRRCPPRVGACARGASACACAVAVLRDNTQQHRKQHQHDPTPPTPPTPTTPNATNTNTKQHHQHQRAAATPCKGC
jgi:hypothetical protein